MSFERAYKNCKICYSNAKTGGYRKGLVSDSVERAMNEAMKALEDNVRNMFLFWMEAGQCKEEMELAEKALKDCAKCDFKQPYIADLLEPEIFKTQEGQEEQNE